MESGGRIGVWEENWVWELWPPRECDQRGEGDHFKGETGCRKQ